MTALYGDECVFVTALRASDVNKCLGPGPSPHIPHCCTLARCNEIFLGTEPRSDQRFSSLCVFMPQVGLLPGGLVSGPET